MHRFFLPPEECASGSPVITDREAHHAANVLRLQPGDRATVLDGAGREFLCAVAEVNRREVRLEILEQHTHAPPPVRITLIQAITKPKAFDLIVQKATELGAHRLVPLLTERVVTRLDDESAEHKVEKWRQVGIESIKQCGSPWLPQIERPGTLKQLLARKESHDLALVAALSGERRHPREYFDAFRRERGSLPASVSVWIGPEGDFTASELDAILANGAKPISLGPNVLRADTAAIYCLSVIGYESGA